MVKALEIEMYRYDTLVFGKVLHQSSEIESGIIVSNIKGFAIQSEGCPELRRTTLYIRGKSAEYDNCIFKQDYTTIEEAVEACNELRELVDEVNCKYSSGEKLPIENIDRIM